MKKMILVLAALTAFGWAATAQKDDFGTWSSIQVLKGWDRVYSMARLEHRSYRNVGATECWFAMAGAGYRITDWLKGDLSYEYWSIPSAGNLTTQKVVATLTGTLKREALAVSVREKWETAFPDSGSASGTLRSRLRAQYTCGIFTPYLMFEHFGSFSFNGGGTSWQRSLHYAGSEIKLSGHHALDLFYMYHMYPAGATHLIGVGYVLSL